MTTEYFNGTILPQNQPMPIELSTDYETKTETITSNTTTTITPSQDKIGISECTITTNVPIKSINKLAIRTENTTTHEYTFFAVRLSSCVPTGNESYTPTSDCLVFKSISDSIFDVYYDFSHYTIPANSYYFNISGTTEDQNNAWFLTHEDTPETHEITQTQFNNLISYGNQGRYPKDAFDFASF